MEVLPRVDLRTRLYDHNKGLSQRRIADIFHVSRRLIQFVIDPSKHEDNLERRKERGGSSAYYDREAHAKAMRVHRKRKDDIYHKRIPQ